MDIVSLYTNHDELFRNWDEHNVARDLISGTWNRSKKLEEWVFHPHSYKNITFFLVLYFRQYNRISHQNIKRNSFLQSSSYHAAGLRFLYVFEPESKLVAKCKYMTAQRMSRSAEVCASFIPFVFSTAVYGFLIFYDLFKKFTAPILACLTTGCYH